VSADSDDDGNPETRRFLNAIDLADSDGEGMNMDAE